MPAFPSSGKRAGEGEVRRRPAASAAVFSV